MDCVISEWTPWGNCSAKCGSGKRQRSRQIEVSAFLLSNRTISDDEDNNQLKFYAITEKTDFNYLAVDYLTNVKRVGRI